MVCFWISFKGLPQKRSQVCTELSITLGITLTSFRFSNLKPAELSCRPLAVQPTAQDITTAKIAFVRRKLNTISL